MGEAQLLRDQRIVIEIQWPSGAREVIELAIRDRLGDALLRDGVKHF